MVASVVVGRVTEGVELGVVISVVVGTTTGSGVVVVDVELVDVGMITVVVIGVVDTGLDEVDVDDGVVGSSTGKEGITVSVMLSERLSEMSLRGNGEGGVWNGSLVVVSGAVVVLFVTIMRFMCFGK